MRDRRPRALTCAAAALVVAALLWPSQAPAPPDPRLDTYCNGCNDIGKRNIELGSNSDTRGDVAAVSRLSVCWDLCSRGLVIYDGHHHALARFGPGRRVRLYVRPRVVRR